MTTKHDAKEATEALYKIKELLKTGRISYDNAKHFALPHLKTLNDYAKEKAAEIGLRPATITFASFMR